MKEAEGLLAGFKQYKFMRALYGLAVSGGIGIVVTLVTRPEPAERARGLVWGTVADALKRYKGSPGTERLVTRAHSGVRVVEFELPPVVSGVPAVRITRTLADQIDASKGDLLYLSDSRRWLGGLHSTHAIVTEILDGDDRELVEMGPQTYAVVVPPRRRKSPVLVERLY